MYWSQQLYLLSSLNITLTMNNALMQHESHNYNNFIIYFAKNNCPINFISTLNLLIKY